jgi:hypothetical protein
MTYLPEDCINRMIEMEWDITTQSSQCRSKAMRELSGLRNTVRFCGAARRG